MDPVTVAIATAIGAGAAGAVKGTTEISKRAIVDAYESLKGLIKSKFGDDSKVVDAVKELEDAPESDLKIAILQEEIGKAKPERDSEILAATQKLIERLRADPTTAQLIKQTAIGTGIAQATGSSNATVTIGADTIRIKH